MIEKKESWRSTGSLIQRFPYFMGKFMLRNHIWDIAKCPYYRGVLISGEFY